MSPTTLDKVITASDVRQRWGQIINEINQAEGPYLVTKRGEPRLVIISIEDYEELIDAKLAASPVLQRRIAEAKSNYEAGEGGSYEVLRQELLKETGEIGAV
jgi:prevent-host-death family protein